MSNRLGGKQGTAYTGTNANQPPNWTFNNRPPTQYDNQNVSIGDLWLDDSATEIERVWILVSLQGDSMSKGVLAEWVQLGSGSLESLTGNSGGPVFPDVNANINVVGDGTTIDIVGNPGSNTLTVSAIPGTPAVETLTGNSGGAVAPTAGNINVLGTGVISVVGNPGTSTLTITPSGAIADSFPTDSGTAIPVAGVLNVFGNTGISTSGSGNTITISATGTPFPQCGFGAYKSVDSNNVTGDGTFYQVICDGELYDLGNDYDPITGIFTAPSTGTYHFDTYIACHNIADQNLSGLNIETTNVIFHSDLQSPVINKSIDNILHFQLSVDINMNAGDTTLIKIALGGGSGAKVVGVTGAIPPGSPVATYFSGHRLDPALSVISGTETFITDAGTATPDISGVVNVLAQNATLGSGSSVIISAPGSSNTIQLDLTDANGNTVLGEGSGNLTMSGTGNTVLGQGSLTSITSGSTNIVIGQGAGNNLTGTETGNILINDPGVTGLNNFFAIHIPSVGAGFTGFDMHNYPGGSSANGTNLFIGEGAGNRTMTAPAWFGNIGIGAGPLQAITTGPHNVAIGGVAGLYITSGDGNVLLGHGTGSNIGAGDGITSGSFNIAIGYTAGTDWRTSDSNNIAIGYGTCVTGDNDTIRIGAKAGVGTPQTRCFIEGIRGRTTGNANAIAVLIDSAGQLGTVSSSQRFKSNIEPMGSVSDRLMKLEPVTFSWKEDQNYIQQIGLIAEEVEVVFPELVVHDKEGLPETVKYHELPVLLLNELKKLAARVADLESKLS